MIHVLSQGREAPSTTEGETGLIGRMFRIKVQHSGPTLKALTTCFLNQFVTRTHMSLAEFETVWVIGISSNHMHTLLMKHIRSLASPVMVAILILLHALEEFRTGFQQGLQCSIVVR